MYHMRYKCGLLNMSKLTTQQYQEQVDNCDGLCVITDDMVIAEPELMRCVTCPFCKVIVNAILTPTSIACPACKIVVSR